MEWGVGQAASEIGRGGVVCFAGGALDECGACAAIGRLFITPFLVFFSLHRHALDEALSSA